MTILFLFVLVVAGIGTVSSTVFLGLALLGARKFHVDAREQAALTAGVEPRLLPAVSVLKPLHGMEPQLERNLESFFEQDYPEFEILFAVDHDDDAALPLARGLCAKYPDVRSRIVINGEPEWPNPPAWSFARMTELARHDILVTSDSDVEVDRDYLRSIAPLLSDPKNGMVTCVYRGLNTGGIWSSLDAMGMSVEMTAGVLVANFLEGMKFGLGPTIAVRRDALEAAGGYAALGEYFSNDFVIGNLIAAKGYEVILSGHVISHVVPGMTFRRMWQRQLRWATGTRYSRPKGHFGTGMVFAVPYGILGFAACALPGHAVAGALMLGWSVLNRLIEAVVIGYGVTRDEDCIRRLWLYPFRDLLGFALWVASYLNGAMRWRDGRFELIEGGRIAVRDRQSANVP